MNFTLTNTAMALTLLLTLCCACARPLAKTVEPQVIQVGSEPMVSDYKDPRKEKLCAEAEKVAFMAWVVMKNEYPDVTSHVAACEIADEEAYWVISLEERNDKNVLNRKVDVMYFLMYNDEGSWDVLRQEPIMQEGAFFDKSRNQPLAPIPEPVLPEIAPNSIDL